MKTKPLFFMLLFLVNWQLFAQNPLVGTWEYQTDTGRSVKIITPTHWMVFTETVNGDEPKFIRAQGGTYSLKGDKYVEHIQIASWDDYGKEKTDFSFKVEGETFHQKGSLTLGDGTIVPIDETWQKVKTESSYDNNPAIGTWNQLSSAYTMADGTKDAHTNATATRLQLITPTHWMRISHRNNKFENAMGGSYSIDGNQVHPKFDFASFSINPSPNAQIEQRVEGDKMYWAGKLRDETGKQTMEFEDVFQKVYPKTKMITKASVSKSKAGK